MAPAPLTLAETASVFGEMLTFRAMLASAAPEQKRAMLASKVEDMINTVVRQIAFYTFERRLHELESLPLVGEVRGRRLMMCVEYVADKATRRHLPDHLNISRRISDVCEANGLIVRPLGHLDILSPPLIITVADVDFIVDTLRGAIEEVTRSLPAC